MKSYCKSSSHISSRLSLFRFTECDNIGLNMKSKVDVLYVRVFIYL